MEKVLHYYQFSIELLSNLLKNAKNSSIIIINNSKVKTATTTKYKNKKGNKIRYMKKTISFQHVPSFQKAFRRLQQKPQTFNKHSFHKRF